MWVVSLVIADSHFNLSQGLVEESYLDKRSYQLIVEADEFSLIIADRWKSINCRKQMNFH